MKKFSDKEKREAIRKRRSGVVGQCFVCGKDVHMKIIYNEKDGSIPSKRADYRICPKDSKCQERRFIHLRGCEPGTKNWLDKFPNSELGKKLYEDRHRRSNNMAKKNAVLVAAVKDMNKYMDPEIDLTLDDEELIKELKDGASILETSDKLKPETWELLLEHNAFKKDSKMFKHATTMAEDAGQEDENDDENENPKTKKKEDKEMSGKKAATKKVASTKEKEETKKKAPAKKSNKQGWREGTSADIIHQTVISAGKSGITKADVVKQIKKKIDSANPEGRVHTVLGAAVARGLVEYDEKKEKYIAV